MLAVRPLCCEWLSPAAQACRRSALGLNRSAASQSRRPAASPVEEVSTLGAQALSRVARKALQEGDYGEERWQGYATRVTELADSLSIREVSQLILKFATARYRGFDLYCRLSSRVAANLDEQEQASPDSTIDVTHLDLRHLAVGFGRARAFDTQLMERLVPLIVDRVHEFRPRDLFRVVDAYARMPVQSPELFALAADALPPYLFDLEPAELSGLVRAFAEAAVYNAELTDALCQEVVQRVRSFGAQECLVFLEGLARLQAGLPEELKRNDKETVAEVVASLVRTLGSLAGSDLVRLFQCLVALDHYDPKVVHGKVLPALAQKLNQLSGPRVFADLAELLHSLSLLPTQSHKSAELALVTASALRSCGPLRQGRVEPRAVALATAALAQLEQEDEETLEALSAALRRPAGSGEAGEGAGRRTSGPGLLSLASNEELLELQRAFGACRGRAAGAAQEALAAELAHREAAGQEKPAPKKVEADEWPLSE